MRGESQTTTENTSFCYRRERKIALLRIRLPPWMSGEKASYRIRMQDAWGWNPPLEDSGCPVPRHWSLTATASKEPPQSPQALPEDTQPDDVSQDRMVALLAVHNLS